MHRFSRRTGEFRKTGFTLVEVLVVMAIIAILVALGIGLLGTAGTAARIERTRVLLKRLDELVKERLQTVDRDKTFSAKFAAKVALRDSSNAVASPKAYAILAKKALQRASLPVRTLDLLGWDQSGMMDDWDDSPVKKNGGISAIADADDQASALFAALCPDGAVPDGVSSDLVATSNGPSSTGKLMFVDAWGSPIRLYLWPTRLVYGGVPSMTPNTSDASILISGLPAANDRIYDFDSADPNGFIKNLTYATGTTTPPGPAVDAGSLHDIGAYSMFLLVSAGPDKALGLTEPNQSGSNGHLAPVTDASALTDNVTNRQGR